MKELKDRTCLNLFLGLQTSHHCLNFQFSLFRSFHLLSLLFFQVIMSMIIKGACSCFCFSYLYILTMQEDGALKLKAYSIYLF